MKVLFLPLNVIGSEQVGQRRGMHEVFGAENVTEIDYLNGQTISIQEYDIAWMQLQETTKIKRSILEELRPKIKLMTQWTGDIREVVPSTIQNIGNLFDVTYIAMSGHIPMYKQHCREVKYMPIAVDPEEVVPDAKVSAPEIVFIGNFYSNFPDSSERLHLMRVLTDKFPNFAVIGNTWPENVRNAGTCPLKDQKNYYASAKVAICINNFNNVRGYYSERNLWCLASGTPVVMRHFPDIETQFASDTCLYFKTVDECVVKVRDALQNDYTEMTQKAQQLVRDKHNWTERFKLLKEDYEKKGNTI